MKYNKRICPNCNKEKDMWDDDKKCWDCREKDKIKKLSEEVKEAGESSGEDYIICPYCGENYEEDDMHETTDVECYGCNKRFHIEVEYYVNYSTSKVKQTEKKTSEEKEE